MRREDAYKVCTYAGWAVALVVAFVVLENVTWPYGNTQLHTIMEVVATLVALIVGVVALVRYYAQRHNMILFLGVGFVGTALLDGYHAIVTSSPVQPYFPSKDFSLIPWSWNASRTFLALLMFSSWLAWRRERKLGAAGQMSDITIYAGAGVLTLICFVFFAFVPLGPAYFPEFIFGRPEEFVAAAFFAAAVFGFLSKQEWQRDPLEHWIINSLIVGFLCQAIFMSRSYGLFDGMFDMAHLLKIVSYALVFIGLLTDISAAWCREQQLSDERAAALARSNEELRFASVTVRGEIEARSEKSTIVRETGDELSGIESLDDAMDLWARQARDIVGAHQSAVSYIPRGNFAEGKHAISMSEKYDKYMTYDVLPTGAGIWGLVAKQKASFCMTDEELKANPSWKNFSDLLGDRGLEHPPMRGWLAVPVLGHGNQFVGVLQLTDKYTGDFTRNDLQRLTRLAQLMAPAFSLQYANEEMQRHSEELALAKSALEQSNLELQHFAYIASHDLQTPLRGIAGFAQFLQKDYQGKLDERADGYIERIVEGAKRMQQLINDLLAYSRVESQAAPFKPVDLNEVFDDAVALLRASIEDTGGKVTRDELPTVAGDRAQLFQLLQNLIGNGLKYHGAEQPRVHVSAEDNGGHWTIAVRDNGIGIDAKHHDRIFEIFRRLHTAEKYPGTGIGLAVCLRIVHRHGGKIWLESEPGQGSTFYFTIQERDSEQS